MNVNITEIYTIFCGFPINFIEKMQERAIFTPIMNKNIITKHIAELEKYGIRSAAVAAGVFDGVHRGHLQVLRAMLRLARITGSTPCVLTFSPHPRSVLAGKQAPKLILPKEEKYRLLFEAGAQAIVELEFTKEFAALAPEEFLRQCLHAGNVRMSGLCVGNAWRFGAGAAGSCETIAAMAEKEDFLFTPVPELMLDDRVVSSTRIRHAISTGAVDAARRMLGRRPSVYGTIVHGMGLAGPVLGFPTANVEINAGLIPAYGVYAVYIMVDGIAYQGAANVGVAPTIRKEEDPKPKFEVHIPDFSGDLYGKTVKVELVRHIRPEMKFNSVDELKAQMAIDLTAVKNCLA